MAGLEQFDRHVDRPILAETGPKAPARARFLVLFDRAVTVRGPALAEGSEDAACGTDMARALCHNDLQHMDMGHLNTRELLALYASVLDTLRERKVVS